MPFISRPAGAALLALVSSTAQADFSLAFNQDDGTTFSFALKAIKPSRYQAPHGPDAR